MVAFRIASSIASAAIAVAGSPLDESVLAALAGVRIAERLSCPAQCELRLVGTEHAERFAIGDDLEVQIHTDDHAAFTGEITAISHDFGPDAMAEVRIRAYDRLHRLRKRQTVRAFADTDVGAVARELVDDLGLSVEVGADAPSWPQLVQHHQSDFELLDDIARRAGLWFVLRDGAVRMLTLAGVDDPVTLTYGADLLEITIDQNSDAACRSVSAFGWEPVDAVALRGDGIDAGVAFDAPDETAPGVWDLDGTRVLVDAPGSSGDALAALARAELDLHVARELVVTGRAAGDARLRVGGLVTIEGLERAAAPSGPGGSGGSGAGTTGLGGPHLLTEVVHTLDTFGYLTRFSSRPPEGRPLPAAASVGLGVVTDADDPEGRGRVQVRFPGLDDVGSLWLPVIAPAAGSAKGFVALPDTDDTVVVLFPHLDPANGLVVGGLFGTEGPSDAGVAGGAVQRYSFATRGGQSVVLDDERQRLVLRDQTGNVVELGADRMLLHAQVDLVIEAPGRSVTVRAKRVDFVEAAEPEDAPSGSGPTPAGPGAGGAAELVPGGDP